MESITVNNRRLRTTQSTVIGIVKRLLKEPLSSEIVFHNLSGIYKDIHKILYYKGYKVYPIVEYIEAENSLKKTIEMQQKIPFFVTIKRNKIEFNYQISPSTVFFSIKNMALGKNNPIIFSSLENPIAAKVYEILKNFRYNVLNSEMN